jgi:hypothetical protein
MFLHTQILNVIVFIFFFGSNVYSSLGGPSTGYYSQKETYAAIPSLSSIYLSALN